MMGVLSLYKDVKLMTQDETIAMNQKELDRLHVFKKLNAKEIGQKEAARLLQISTRQIRRLQKRFLLEGAQGLASKKRARASNRKFTENFKDEVLALVKKDYYDYGPTLAAEKLKEYNNLIVSKETLRLWMIDDGLWKAKPIKLEKNHQPRNRRPYFGELIQIDGSVHAWFEERGPKCTLLVFIDDATSLIQSLRFVKAETTHDYLQVLKQYVKTYGKPRALYSDKHVVFRVNIKDPKSGNGLTQFGRVLQKLNIQSIFAHSPQAKGRVERANSTLQDRLLKELRYHNISDMNSANQFLESFRLDYNQRFGKSPKDPLNVHTALSFEELADLDKTCTVQVLHKVSKNLTLQHKKVLYKLKVPGKGHRLRQEGVVVCEDESGKINILYNNQPLEYEVYAEHHEVSQPISRKEIDALLDQVNVRHYASQIAAGLQRRRA